MAELSSLEELWWMLGALFFFHTSEYVLALLFHGRGVSLGSFLISGPYLVALGCSFVEHGVESRYAPWMKTLSPVSYMGLAMVVVGEFMRKCAVVTANHSFTHDIKTFHRPEHRLVTHGIYRFFRHPGYLGFLIWSVGSQVLLCNPVCTVGYTIVMWRFFRDRIPYPSQFAHPVYFSTMWHIFMLQMSTEWHEYLLKHKCGNSVGLGFRVSLLNCKPIPF
ncbi:hypothetical protein CY35_07G110500 [Sphagnum magellanicum]|uniref:Uncharacterized protein n=1 Tax=Sphagnum magellanicum TaxID=128215 RepID=A0ACB8HQ79_9BRYO|nr:hypothetical protein CY35_07G110500 [Sphagnum magellanicum]